MKDGNPHSYLSSLQTPYHQGNDHHDMISIPIMDDDDCFKSREMTTTSHEGQKEVNNLDCVITNKRNNGQNASFHYRSHFPCLLQSMTTKQEQQQKKLRGMIPLDVHGDIRGMISEDEDDYIEPQQVTVRGMIPEDNIDAHQQQRRLVYQQQQQQQQQQHYLNNLPPTTTTARVYRLLVETHGLLYDYQRRFYPRSLQEEAVELLEQAVSDSTVDGVPARQLAMFTDALKLCKKSIQDQRRQNNELNNNDENVIANNIRIRCKTELLVTKIYYNRAVIYYNVGNYNRCVKDCDSAIKFWNRINRRSSGNRQLRKRINALRVKLVSSRRPKQKQQRRLVELCIEKHLYVLKAKGLAGLGLYDEASNLLLHSDNAPYQELHNAGMMYKFLRDVSNNRGTTTREVTRTASSSILPMDQKLLPHLIHAVQKRLFHDAFLPALSTTSKCAKTNSGSTRHSYNSCTISTTYQMIRYGGDFFHH